MGGRKSSVRDFSVQIRDKISVPALQQFKKIPLPIENYLNPLQNPGKCWFLRLLKTNK